MATMLETAYLAEELDALYREQRQSERAELDGRVVDRAAWRVAIDRRAELIRRLEKRLAVLGHATPAAADEERAEG